MSRRSLITEYQAALEKARAKVEHLTRVVRAIADEPCASSLREGFCKDDEPCGTCIARRALELEEDHA